MTCDHGVWSVGVEASAMLSSPVGILLILGSEATSSQSGHYFCVPKRLCRGLFRQVSFPEASLL